MRIITMVEITTCGKRQQEELLIQLQWLLRFRNVQIGGSLKYRRLMKALPQHHELVDLLMSLRRPCGCAISHCEDLVASKCALASCSCAA